ncbi:MAG: DUF2959 family protein [Planctomycetota bacterium]
MFSYDQSGGGPSRVEDLVTRVEAVHVECEVSRERLRESVSTLHRVLDTASQNDPLESFAALETALKESEKQARSLRDSIAPLKKAASPFFEQWSNDLGAFTSVSLRQRSQERLAETRARYDAVIATVEPAQALYDSFNVALRDHILFLGHDFNASSVAVIQGEVEHLDARALELAGIFESGMTKTRDYIVSTAPPLRFETEAEPATSPPAK